MRGHPRSGLTPGRRAGRALPRPPTVSEAQSRPGAWPPCLPGAGARAGSTGPASAGTAIPGQDARAAERTCRLSGRHRVTPGQHRGRAANLSAPCPSNHLQVQTIAETRPKRAAAPPAHPEPGETTFCAQQSPLRRLGPATPGPAPTARHSRDAAVGRRCACAGRGAPRPSRPLRGGSPRPLTALWLPPLTWGRAW